MGDILTYLDKYGDNTFQDSKFNEVDNLILSQISYLDFEEIVPSIDSNDFIKVQEACYAYFLKFSESELSGLTHLVLKGMANCKRFKEAKLSQYISLFDEKEQKQFAALHIELDDGSVYVAFRGTDDRLISWQEDFSMSYRTTPSQVEALSYLENTLANSNKFFRVGGHSKGGNLAVFASMWCQDSIKNKIIEVYDNDGPGFDKQIFKSNEYKNIANKLIRFVPGYCVFGMLFKHKAIKDYTIVNSTAKGIFQHDSMTWEVEGNNFVRKEKFIKQSVLISKMLNNWIDGVELEQRKAFTNLFFNSLESKGLKTVTDIFKAGNKKIIGVIKTMVVSDRNSIFTFAVLVKSFLSIYVIGMVLIK